MNDNLSVTDRNFDFENVNSLSKLKNLMKDHPFNINQGYLIGGGAIRIAVMGFDDREASSEEIKNAASFRRRIKVWCVWNFLRTYLSTWFLYLY